MENYFAYFDDEEGIVPLLMVYQIICACSRKLEQRKSDFDMDYVYFCRITLGEGAKGRLL